MSWSLSLGCAEYGICERWPLGLLRHRDSLCGLPTRLHSNTTDGCGRQPLDRAENAKTGVDVVPFKKGELPRRDRTGVDVLQGFEAAIVKTAFVARLTDKRRTG